MSLLPKKKKSVEEIAKIREGLGIPGDPLIEKKSPEAVSGMSVVPTPVEPTPLPVELLPAPQPAESVSQPMANRGPKLVRSLRKSEQVPLPVERPPVRSVESILPILKHSDSELQELRRREALAAIGKSGQSIHPLLKRAHPMMLVPGYLFVTAAPICYQGYDLAIQAPAACVVFALVFSVLIFIKNPQSRHHSAFIAVTAIFVIVFGALHYFPQLRYGT